MAPSIGKIRFVAQGGADTNDGTSWENAFLTGAQARSSLSGDGTIWLGEGIFMASGDIQSGDTIEVIGQSPSIFNVLDFGADRTETSNSHVAIQAALDAVPSTGGVVIIPSGTYLVGVKIEINTDKTTVVGYGLPTLQVNGTDVFVLQADGRSDIKVQGIRFYDDDPANHVGTEESHGVQFKGSSIRCRVLDCEFDGIGDESVDISGSSRVWVERCRFTNVPSIATSGAVTINTSSEVWVCRNQFDTPNKGAFIRMEVTASGQTVTDVQILQNDFTCNTAVDTSAITGPLGSGNVARVTIAGNIIRNSGNCAIRLLPLTDRFYDDVIISHNVIDGGGNQADIFPSLRGAICCENGRVRRATIVGNTIRNWGVGRGQSGILVVDGVVVGNHIESVPDGAIRLASDTQGSVAVGNVCLSFDSDSDNFGTGIVASKFSVVNGNLVDTGDRGIDTGAPDVAAAQPLIVGNTIRNCTEYGLRVSEEGYGMFNLCEGNNTGIIAGASSLAGIPHLMDNVVLNSTTNDLLDSAATSVITGRVGDVVTDGSGTQTVSNGTTSVTFAHNLKGTVALSDVQVTPIEDMGSASKFWVTAPTASQLRINVDADPGQDVDFVWSVIKRG